MANILFLELDISNKFLNDTKNFFNNSADSNLIGFKILISLVKEMQFDNTLQARFKR